MPEVRARLRSKTEEGRLGDIWYRDEVFIRINGQKQYLWRAVDQDGDVIDILLQSRRDQHAAERFLRRLVRGQGKEPHQEKREERERGTLLSRVAAWVPM